MYEYEPECFNMDQCDKYMPTPLFEKGPLIQNPLLEPEKEPEIPTIPKKCNIFSSMDVIFPFENKNKNYMLLLFVLLIILFLGFKRN
tara:strand:- start:3686 stop:3946 length:261 start_codon:yes stop_codon:yes gene_type:complete